MRINHGDFRLLVNVKGKRMKQKAIVARCLEDVDKACFAFFDDKVGNSRQVDNSNDNLATLVFILKTFLEDA